MLISEVKCSPERKKKQLITPLNRIFKDISSADENK
jgi:hypothetical protein